jgi:acyl-CoA dehydrogenase
MRLSELTYRLGHSMQRRVLGPQHEEFRQVIRTVLERSAVDHQAEWDEAGRMPASFFEALGDSGLFGLDVDVEYGGQGPADYGFKMVAWEEAARLGVGIATPRTHTDVVTPYFVRYGSAEQKARWLPGVASGRTMAAIAMSEPDTGSDLAGIRTRAVREGDEYVINGAKAFITGGHVADLVIVIARTSERFDASGRGVGSVGICARQPVEEAGSDEFGHHGLVLRQCPGTGREPAR